MRTTVVLLALLVPLAAFADETTYTISENEKIHVVQQKDSLLGDTFELSAAPATVQLNARWSQHFGFAAGAAFHVSDEFALRASFAHNLFFSRETDLQDELREKAFLQPPSAPSILSRTSLIAAVEVSPVYGKLGFYEDSLLAFSLFVSAGAGVVDTAVQLVAAGGDREGQVTASAGLRPSGLLAAGFRVRLGASWMLRLEVQDLVYSSRITHLNGCSRPELEGFEAPSNRCRMDRFEVQGIDQALAADRADGSSGTASQVSAQLGLSFLF